MNICFMRVMTYMTKIAKIRYKDKVIVMVFK